MSASLKASGETELVPDFRLMDGYGQFLGEPDQRLHLEAHDEGIVLIIEEWLVVDEGLALHLEEVGQHGVLACERQQALNTCAQAGLVAAADHDDVDAAAPGVGVKGHPDRIRITRRTERILIGVTVEVQPRD